MLQGEHSAILLTMLQGEHSAILLTIIKLPFAIMAFVLSIFEWLLTTGFTVLMSKCSVISDVQNTKRRSVYFVSHVNSVSAINVLSGVEL